MDIFEMAGVLAKISYKKWKFKLRRKYKDGPIYLQVQFKAPCADDHNVPQMETQRGRKWLLSKHMTKSELVQTAFKAVITAEEHEVRERFAYRGEAIFGPHFDVDELWGLASDERVDVRANGRSETAVTSPASRQPSGAPPSKGDKTHGRPATDDGGLEILPSADEVRHAFMKIGQALKEENYLPDDRCEEAVDAFKDFPNKSLSEPFPKEGITKMTNESHK